MRELVSKIEETAEELGNQELPMNPVFAPKPSDITSLVDNYWMSLYRDSNYDENGNKKIFFNQIETPVINSAKMIDFDVSDFNIIPHYNNGNHSQIKGVIFEDALHQYLRVNGYGKFVNDLTLYLPKYGWVIIKKIVRDGETHMKLVPVQNIRAQCNVDKLENSSFLAEKHVFLPEQLESYGFDKKDLMKVKNLAGEKPVTIYEYYGKLDDSSNDYHIIADIEEKGEEIVLDASERNINDYYRDIYWDKVPGRLQGVGQVEKLFEAQIHLNKVAYWKEKGLHWTSKHIYQTTDRGIAENLLDEVDDGQVLTPRDRLEPVPMEERNLSAYREEEEQWYRSISDRTFTSDVTQGKQPTSGVPLGASVLASQMASGFFSRIQENIAVELKDCVFDWILPSFRKKMKKGFIHRYIGASDEKQALIDQAILNARVNRKIKRHFKNNGNFPTQSQIQIMRSAEQERLKNPENREFNVIDNWFDDLRYDLELVIVGESTNVEGKMTAIKTALNAVQAPEEKRKLINRMMVLLGEEPLFSTSGPQAEDILMMQGRQGSPPKPETVPTMTRQTTTV